MIRYTFFAFLALFIFSCSSVTEEPLTDYPNSHLLVSAEQLAQIIESDDILLIDARAEVEDGFIPGAVHFPAISNLTDPDHPVQHFLVGPDRFQELMQETGLNNDSRVIIYDGGNSLASARLFYALDYYGFSNASILNGGIQAWTEQGYDLENESSEPVAGNFQFQIQEALACDFEYITAAAESDDKIVFDARSRMSTPVMTNGQRLAVTYQMRYTSSGAKFCSRKASLTSCPQPIFRVSTLSLVSPPTRKSFHTATQTSAARTPTSRFA